jgi:hypothetical protein
LNELLGETGVIEKIKAPVVAGAYGVKSKNHSTPPLALAAV